MIVIIKSFFEVVCLSDVFLLWKCNGFNKINIVHEKVVLLRFAAFGVLCYGGQPSPGIYKKWKRRLVSDEGIEPLVSHPLV